MPSDYPQWRFFPAHVAPPGWCSQIASIFAAHRMSIDSEVDHATRITSDDALAMLADDLADMGFAVETGKTKAAKLARPVFFGDQGRPSRMYEIDAFHPEDGIALEVEAGRATMGNAIYRDLVQTSLIVDARYLALAVPAEYRYKNGNKVTKEPSYTKAYSVIEAIYGTDRLKLPFEGLMLVGY